MIMGGFPDKENPRQPMRVEIVSKQDPIYPRLKQWVESSLSRICKDGTKPVMIESIKCGDITYFNKLEILFTYAYNVFNNHRKYSTELKVFEGSNASGGYTSTISYICAICMNLSEFEGVSYISIAEIVDRNNNPIIRNFNEGIKELFGMANLALNTFDEKVRFEFGEDGKLKIKE